MSTQLKNHINDSCHLVVGVLTLWSVACNYLVDISRGSPEPRMVASGASIQKMLSLHYGVWLYLTWLAESHSLYKNLL